MKKLCLSKCLSRHWQCGREVKTHKAHCGADSKGTCSFSLWALKEKGLLSWNKGLHDVNHTNALDKFPSVSITKVCLCGTLLESFLCCIALRVGNATISVALSTASHVYLHFGKHCGILYEIIFLTNQKHQLVSVITISFPNWAVWLLVWLCSE